MPRAEDFPDLLSKLTEVPAKTNPSTLRAQAKPEQLARLRPS